MIDTKWITVKEAADIISVPKSTLHEWVMKGFVPSYKIISKRRINLEEFMCFLKTKKLPVMGNGRKDLCGKKEQVYITPGLEDVKSL